MEGAQRRVRKWPRLEGMTVHVRRVYIGHAVRREVDTMRVSAERTRASESERETDGGRLVRLFD
jgi:hypothetical protein